MAPGDHDLLGGTRDPLGCCEARMKFLVSARLWERPSIERRFVVRDPRMVDLDVRGSGPIGHAFRDVLDSTASRARKPIAIDPGTLDSADVYRAALG